MVLFFHIRNRAVYPNIIQINDSSSVNLKTSLDAVNTNDFLIDTTAILILKNLSFLYNYKIIDTVYKSNDEYFCGKTKRIIEISNKEDSIIQIIYVDKMDQPNYLYFSCKNEPKYRSQITGKNFKKRVVDDYFGELVIADLNFDGLEDFATPIDYGCDNGSHQAFYIQDENGSFTLNIYLTDSVIWFPQEINVKKKTFKTITNAGSFGVCYKTFLFDTTSQKWKLFDHYDRIIATGKIERY